MISEKVTSKKSNPAANANLISRVFFWWLNSLFRIGFHRSIDASDLYDILDEDSANTLGDLLETEWKKEVKKEKASLKWAVIRAFGVSFMMKGVFVLIEESVKVAQPMMMMMMLQLLMEDGVGTNRVTTLYMYAMGISLAAVVVATFHHPYFHGVSILGMRLRVACSSLIYRKTLRLGHAAFRSTATGKIINLVATDADKFDQITLYIHYLWVGVLQAIVLIVFLWREMGAACLGGLGLLVALMPLQGWMGKLFGKLREKTNVQIDERVRLLHEVVCAIRTIKMFCWERPYMDLIRIVRKQELLLLFRHHCVSSVYNVLRFVSRHLMVLSSLVPLVLSGRAWSPVAIIPAMLFFDQLRRFLISQLMLGIERLNLARLALDRLQAFLLLPECDELPRAVSPSKTADPASPAVEVKDLCATWSERPEVLHLSGLTFAVKKGGMLAVIGPVGSGKSTLLSVLLRELTPKSGSVHVLGRVSYGAQVPWVFQATVRQNIVCGLPYDPSKFASVVRACALREDLKHLPEGEMTWVGDRGVTLSGGQKARVSLARALYADADVYLLDDPLNAVDAHVARHLFDECINGYLKNKTRIMVTNQMHHLETADQILVLREGHLDVIGSFAELSQSGVEWGQLLPRCPDDHLSSRAGSHVSAPLAPTPAPESNGKVKDAPDCHEESRQRGSVSWLVYLRYFRAGATLPALVAVCFVFLVAQALFLLSDYFLAQWSDAQQLSSNNVTAPRLSGLINPARPVATLGVYVGFQVFLVISGFARSILFFLICMRASRRHHRRILQRLMHAPVLFFDTNPAGRILNRFSKDIATADDVGPLTFFDFTECLLQVLGTIILLCVINPWVLLFTFPLTLLFVWLRYYYVRTSRDIKRLEAAARSPVLSHLAETINGLATIRSLPLQSSFLHEFDALQDRHSQAWSLYLAAQRWLAIRLDWLCAVFICLVCFSAIAMRDSLNVGLIGLSVTYSISLMTIFQWCIRQSAEVENQMTSIERVFEYTELPQEPVWERYPAPPDGWPNRGSILIENACFRYGPDTPIVLQHISAFIRPGEKVGIVGRTGAGKSSLVHMLLRLAEPSGRIVLDGIDIASLGVQQLRRSLGVIPQEPILFCGPFRRNLDPIGSCKDDQLWSALEQVHLRQVVEDLPGGLDSHVQEGGSNLSVGQQQLVCLARALLRKSRVVILDEATSNVDPKTDELIQQAIRQQFSKCTVLTIAHRLQSVMDSARIMVLDAGQIVEFGSPWQLLQQSSSRLLELVTETGSQEAERLFQLAQCSFLEKHPKREISAPAGVDDVALSTSDKETDEFISAGSSPTTKTP